jgi:two-component system, NtrC family, response regulator AtoC
VSSQPTVVCSHWHPYCTSLAVGFGRILASKETCSQGNSGFGQPMTSLVSTGESSFVASISPAMAMLETVASEIAGTNIPILLLGEVGTGKEIFARRIHDLSPRRDGRFMRVACASTTAEGFLGDFSQSGDVEVHGTLLLDEINELDAACQCKLLCALPAGGENERGRLSARVISTSSRNLDEEIRTGRFGSELYYRLNPVCLRLPPLRERKSDIPYLTEHFLAKQAAELGRALPKLTPASLESLTNYSWPGNIRELENAMKKIVALNDQSFVSSELAGSGTSSSRSGAEAGSESYSLKAVARAASREAERDLILKALARTRWNRKRAAQELQVSYKSLLYKLKQIG